MSWLGQMRPHRRDEVWSASLWQTFFDMTMGTQIPVIVEKPLETCGCILAGSFNWMRWETISVLVPLIRVPKRLMTERLSNWLTFSVPRGVLGLPERKSRQHPHQGSSFTCQFECWWGTYHFKNTHSPITLADIWATSSSHLQFYGSIWILMTNT